MDATTTDSIIAYGWCWGCHEAGDVLPGHSRCYYVEPEVRELIDRRKATLWYEREWYVLRLPLD